MKNFLKPIVTARCTALLGALVLVAPTAQATLTIASWNSGFANAGVVPDGNVMGWSDTRVLSGIAENSILDVNVTLQLNGGWNGDLYGYLAHSSGFSVLLNRAGRTGGDAFGYSDAGLNVRFDDAAANGDIHLYQTVPGYATAITDGSAWAPDGRSASPMTVVGTDPRTLLLSSFNGLNPNGSWTLFLADLSGGEVITVAGWGLEINAISAVPEASTWVVGLATFGLLGASEWRRHRRAR